MRIHEVLSRKDQRGVGLIW